jgi:transcriptional regulator with XRE-family HTH domain
MKLRRLRNFLELRQIDIERGTGISVRWLSAAEAGRLELSQSEAILLRDFLFVKLQALVATEG